MASPVAVSVEKPQALSGTANGVIPRFLKALRRLFPCQSRPSPKRTMLVSGLVAVMCDQEKERESTASSMRPASKLLPDPSAVTVTRAGLNNMRSIA